MWEKIISSVVRGTIMWERLISSVVRGTIMWERLISSVVRGDYYVGEVNIICCKRGLLCGRG
jgi:hypothetical protein